MTSPYVLFVAAALAAAPVLTMELDESTNAILAAICLAFGYGGFEALASRKANSYNTKL